LLRGDASALDLPIASFDLVLQSVCFSSILDDGLLASIAHRAWTLLRPGGALLSYDFTVNNPRNPNVRGISVARLQSLFPEGQLTARRVTLAPPIARAIWSSRYPLLSAVPFLRTHAWCLIRKPESSRAVTP
jgi:SAM-dependent methyltransferase